MIPLIISSWLSPGANYIARYRTLIRMSQWGHYRRLWILLRSPRWRWILIRFSCSQRHLPSLRHCDFRINRGLAPLEVFEFSRASSFRNLKSLGAMNQNKLLSGLVKEFVMVLFSSSCQLLLFQQSYTEGFEFSLASLIVDGVHDICCYVCIQ